MGAKIIFLDDGFSKSFIQKFDILVKPNPEPQNSFCLPSGPYREQRSLYAKADLVITEDTDFTRHVEVINPTARMLLVTAISKPSRLEPYLPANIIGKVTFRDHYMYHEKELQNLANPKYSTPGSRAMQQQLAILLEHESKKKFLEPNESNIKNSSTQSWSKNFKLLLLSQV